MRLIISTILIAFFASLAEFFFPWWTIAVSAFVISLFFNLRPGQAFLSGFLGIVIFWLPNILFKDISNEHILSKKMAVLFSVPHYGVFITVCVLVGSLVGGLASLSGALLRKGE